MRQGMRKRFGKGMALGLMTMLLLGACGEKDMENSMNVTEASGTQTSEAAENETKENNAENTALAETKSPEKVNDKLSCPVV